MPFEGAARDLPWRRDRSGYHALVSELMLQQTQVSRVLEKFGPFVARFPTVAALAAAPEDEVLAAWQGLGYNRRALALHRAAKMVAAGGWPGWPTFLLVTLAMVGARTMAMALNRLIDWRLDALNPRTQNRHLPRGLVKPGETLALALLGLLLQRRRRRLVGRKLPPEAQLVLLELAQV